jgi:hypothetical protein
MDKLLKIFVLFLGLSGLAFLGACSDDIDPEITELNVSRLFTPTNVEIRIIDQTGVRVSWNKVKGASRYTVDFYEGAAGEVSGTPVESFSEVIENVIEVPGFDGETTYTVVIKAVGEGIADSKLVAVTFTTGTEAIFEELDPEGLTASSVILNWPAGEFATAIILTPESGDVIEYEVTAADIEAGMAEITGLQSETTYTAKLMNGTKTRGTLVFQTLIDLDGATAVHPEDNLNEVIQAAVDGEVLVLFPGVYDVFTGDVVIAKSLTIRGLYPHDKPVIFNRLVFEAGVNDFSISSVEMNGTIVDGETSTLLAQAMNFNSGTYNVNSLVIDDCVIYGYNQALVYAGSSSVVKVNTLTVNNSIVSDIKNDGGDFIDFRGGHVGNLNITNSTFDNVAGAPRDFLRLDNSSANFPGSTCTVTIDKCTFWNVSNGRRLLYVRFDANVLNVTNTIIAGPEGYGGYFSNQSLTSQPICNNNNYFNAPLFVSGEISNGKYDISGSERTVNPGFANVESGDFTVSDEDVIFYEIGDPRWR